MTKKISKRNIRFEKAAQAGLFGTAFPLTMIACNSSPDDLLRDLEIDVSLGRLDAAGVLEVAKSIIAGLCRDIYQLEDYKSRNEELREKLDCSAEENSELKKEIELKDRNEKLRMELNSCKDYEYGDGTDDD